MKFEDGIDKNIGNFQYVERDMFTTPFFTKEYCGYLVGLFEDVGFDPTGDEEQNVLDTWTYDCFLDRVENGEDICRDWLKCVEENIESEIVKNWHAPIRGRLWKGYPVPFCTKFSKDTKKNLRYHNDNSLLTIFIKLNGDFGGCETVYPRQEWDSSNLEVGHMLVLPGSVTHPHYTRPLEWGVKYSLIGRHSILEPRCNRFDDIRNLNY